MENNSISNVDGDINYRRRLLPIATAQSSTGEYTRSIFQVVTIALLVSWVAAVLFVPYLGENYYLILPRQVIKHLGMSVYGQE